MMKKPLHQLVTIEDFDYAPCLYTKVYCDKQDHREGDCQKELTEACQYCHEVFCVLDRDEMMEKCWEAPGMSQTLQQNRFAVYGVFFWNFICILLWIHLHQGFYSLDPLQIFIICEIRAVPPLKKADNSEVFFENQSSHISLF